MTKIKIKIIASVETTVELAEGETIEEFKKRNVDIYLHGAGEKGWLDKEDLGGTSTIWVEEA